MVEQPLGRLAYQTLLDVCMDCWTTRVISSIENEILLDDSDCWNRAIQLANTFAIQIEDQLPLELTRRIVKSIIHRSSHAGFIMASRLSSSLESINLSQYYGQAFASDFPPPQIVSSLFSDLAEGLHRVHLKGPYVTDDAIEALSLSCAAKTIQELRFSNALISDASAHVWQHFSSLRSLYFSSCNVIDLVTFMALSKHEVLEKFTALPDAGAPPASTIIPILLAPDSLPNLTSLYVSSGLDTIALRDLAELMQRRPNRQQFKELGRAEQDGDETDLMVEIHELCPNLEDLCAPMCHDWTSLPERLLPHLRNIKELRDEEIVIQSDEDLFSIADRFPCVDSICLDGFSLEDFTGFPFFNFGSFTNLKSLFLKSSVLAPLQLPPSLTDVSYALHGAQGVSLPSDQVNALCLSICECAPKLKYLGITLPGSSLTRHHAILLLNHLPALKHLMLRDESQPTGTRERLEICHPKLSYADLAAVQLSPVPLWWPNKSHMIIQEFVEPMVDMLQPIRAPNLRGLNVSSLDCQTEPCSTCGLIEAIRGFDCQIVTLTLDTSLTRDSLRSLLSLRHLSLLYLRNMPLTQESAHMIVSHLQLLSQLDFTFLPETSDASWLRLPHLRSLTLTLTMDQSRIMKSGSRDPAALILQPENMPLLAKLIVKSKTPVISGLHLSGFEHLGNAELTSSVTWSFDMSVSNCKYFFDLTIQDALLHSLRLSELPSLMKLEFRTCLLHDEATLSVSECPRLRVCESCKNRASPEGVEKCRQLEEAIRLQAADVKNFRFI